MPEHSCTDCEWLLAKTTPVPEIACIIVVDANWSRPVNGYGVVRTGHAHRWFYQHATGIRLPSHLHVRHACDIRPCINLEHLSHGTPQDNIDDMVKRNRNKHEDSHHWSKINSTLARAIVTAYQAGRDDHPGTRLTQYQIADLFGVNQATVSRIWRGRTWYRATAEDGVRRDVPDAGRILTVDGVRFMRKNSQTLSVDELSAMFGTHRDNVRKILSGQYWSEVD